MGPVGDESPRERCSRGLPSVREEVLLEGHVDEHLVTVRAGVHDADTRARAGDLRRTERVELRPVAVRVAVIERRDRSLRGYDGRNAVAVEGHLVGGLLTERGIERLTAVAKHDAAIEHDRRGACVDRQSLATTRVGDGVVVGARAVGVPVSYT